MPAFGMRASAWAARLADPDEILAIDPSGAVDGARDAFVRRARGPALAVAALCEDDAVIDARGLAAAVVQQHADNDLRRSMLDQIEAGTMVVNGKPQHETHFADVTGRGFLYFAVRLAETIVAGSWAEAQRLRKYHPTPSVPIARIAPRDPLVPAVGPDADADAVVVWAPALAASDVAIVLLGLDQIRLPQIVVCSGGRVTGTRAQFVGLLSAADALRRAKVVIDAGPADAGTARTLGALGIPLVAPQASGIEEWLDHVAVYDPRSRKSVEIAVRTALGSPPPRARPDALDALLSPPVLRINGPLVSVVIPTYNRRAILGPTLASWERQLYHNLEIVVVNDAGEDIADVVAPFARARCVNRDTNGRQAAACNTGIEAARGDALVFCGDDDFVFPDHVARLVDALERSGAGIAHAEGMIAYLEGADVVSLHGFGMGVDDMAEHDVTNAFYPPHAILVRRDVVERAGRFDPSLRVAEDYDYWLRLAAEADVVHVPSTTCAYAARADDSHVSVRHRAELPAAHAAIYARHPRPGRPSVEARRAALIEQWSQSTARLGHGSATWRFNAPVALDILFH
jgi:GT2 family glycosyltransferase